MHFSILKVGWWDEVVWGASYRRMFRIFALSEDVEIINGYVQNQNGKSTDSRIIIAILILIIQKVWAIKVARKGFKQTPRHAARHLAAAFESRRELPHRWKSARAGSKTRNPAPSGSLRPPPGPSKWLEKRWGGLQDT